MASRKKLKTKVPKLLIVVLILVSLILIFGFLKKKNYTDCLNINLAMCLGSKQYTSERGLFSLRYPSDYPLSPIDDRRFKDENDYYALGNSPTKALYEVIDFSKEFYGSAGGDRIVYIRVEKNNLNNVDEYVDQEMKSYEEVSDKFKESTPKPEFKYLTISGERAVVRSIGQVPNSFTTPEERYILFHNGLMYFISFYYDEYYHKSPVEHYEQGKKVILSTFRFNQ